jgi:hypothetical protein
MSLVPYKVTAIKKADPTGNNVLAGASVSIVTPLGVFAQLWDDEAGTIPRSNPFNVDSNGERQVWLNGGSYLVSVEGGQSWDISINGSTDIASVGAISSLRSLNPAVNDIYYVQQHGAYPGQGGDTFKAFAGTVVDDDAFNIASMNPMIHFSRINSYEIHIAMFGGSPSAADNQLAMAKALDFCQVSGRNRIFFDYGNYKTSQLMPTINKPVTLIGRGNGDRGSPVGINKGTEIEYTGAITNNFMFSYKEVWYGGAGLKDLTLFCNNRCSGLVIDSCTGMEVSNFSIKDDSYLGILLTATTTTTCSWNRLDGVLIDDYTASGGLAALHLDGGPGLGNACHNTFTNLRINHNNARQGILLGYCDNNSFYMSFIYKVGGAGYSIYGDTAKGGGFPGNNVFYHVQAIGGVYQDAGSIFPMAAYYGYQQDNGEPLPVNAGLPTATPIVITDNGRYFGIREINYRGRADQQNYGNSTLTAGATSLVVTIPDMQTNDFWVSITPTSNTGGPTWWVASPTSGVGTSSFTFRMSAALAGNFNFQWQVVEFKSN